MKLEENNLSNACAIDLFMGKEIIQVRRSSVFGIHNKPTKKEYNKENQRPILHCSICNGEQIAGFKDIHTGKFDEVMLIRSEDDLEYFKQQYGVDEIEKEY